jgi:CheY-like chemotaxis protein
VKVLLADDSIFVRKFVSKFLLDAKPGLGIIFAANGEEGYRKYREEKPDLVVTDLLMPVMDGRAFIEKIRETDARTPVVVLSADVQKSVREELNALGIVAFLNKPVSREGIARIAGLLGGE